jgi:hypothetical protein
MAAAKIVRRPREIILVDGKGKEFGIEISIGKDKRVGISDKSVRFICMTLIALSTIGTTTPGGFAKPIAVILRGMLE